MSDPVTPSPTPPQAMDETVKACPFCGEAPEITRLPSEHFRAGVDRLVQCRTEDCAGNNGPRAFLYAWNRRAALPAVPPRRDEVEALPRFDLGNDCDGESGRCCAQMEASDDGEYVEYAALLALYRPAGETPITAFDKCPDERGCGCTTHCVRYPPAGETRAECVWTHNDDGFWATSCGESWVLSNDEGPSANGMKFCHACGKPLFALPPSHAGEAK